MRLGVSQLSVHGSEARLSAEVEIAGEIRTWWISVPPSFGPQLDCGPAPFVPTAVLLAAATGEDLIVDPPMSGRQLEGARRAAAMYAKWWGWRRPELHATTVESTEVRGAESALLFTRGVDSTASLITALRDRDPEVTFLVGIEGLEPAQSPDVAAAVMADTEAAARSVDLPFIRIGTNLKAEADPYADWGKHAHGAVLLGCVLSLGRMFRHVSISPTVDITNVVPHGSTPHLDGCWATDRTEIRNTDMRLNRVDRVAIVATRPDLARRLKVCWEGNQRGNCGHCLKCLHTMTAFVITGNADLVPEVFDAPFSVEAIRNVLPAPGLAVRAIIDRIDDADLREAWNEALARHRWGQRAGLAGANPAVVPEGAKFEDGTWRPAGWGIDAATIVVPEVHAHHLVAQRPVVDRPIRWAVVDRATTDATRLASWLTEAWEDGAVLLTDLDVPGPMPSAVRRLLDRTTLRVWWRKEPYLDAIALLEAVDAGCVPLQVMPCDVVAALKAALPPRARCIVRSEVELELGFPAADELLAMWTGAVELLATSAREEVPA